RRAGAAPAPLQRPRLSSAIHGTGQAPARNGLEARSLYGWAVAYGGLGDDILHDGRKTSLLFGGEGQDGIRAIGAPIGYEGIGNIGQRWQRRRYPGWRLRCRWDRLWRPPGMTSCTATRPTSLASRPRPCSGVTGTTASACTKWAAPMRSCKPGQPAWEIT